MALSKESTKPPREGVRLPEAGSVQTSQSSSDKWMELEVMAQEGIA